MKNRLRVAYNRLSPLQRQTVNRIWAYLIVMGLISAADHFVLEYGDRAKALVVVFAVLPAIPTFAILIVLGRYLVRERDEFIRMMVVKALLWGAAVTVAGDMVQSALSALNAIFWGLDPGSLTIMNFDLFFTASLFSLLIQLRRNR
jgi:hypothetical protein